MDEPIILIGPMMAGKSTLGGLVAERLGLEHYELDDLRWDYYKEIGYDPELALRLREEQGPQAMFRYWKPFEAHAVERVLAEHPGGVISFGAGHSVYEDEALFERARRALEPVQNVVLVLPSQDEAAGVKILTERFVAVLEAEGITPSPETLEVIGYFLRHPANRLLAKQVVVTEGMTPEEVCEAVVRGLV